MTGKPKISASRTQVLPDIDLRQTRFRIDWNKKLGYVKEMVKYWNVIQRASGHLYTVCGTSFIKVYT